MKNRPLPISPPEVWTVAQAKARLSEVIDQARRIGPQPITRHGKPAVVVVDAETWAKSQAPRARGSLADFLHASPLRGSGLVTERLPGGVHEPEL